MIKLPFTDPGRPDIRSPVRYLLWVARHQWSTLLGGVFFGVIWMVSQALMPAAVKERFALRPAFATGIYVLGFNIGSALSSVFAVPIADATGSWRWSLVVFSADCRGRLEREVSGEHGQLPKHLLLVRPK